MAIRANNVAFRYLIEQPIHGCSVERHIGNRIYLLASHVIEFHHANGVRKSAVSARLVSEFFDYRLSFCSQVFSGFSECCLAFFGFEVFADMDGVPCSVVSH